jgi:DNA-binding MarR family transcriptional regulator
MTFPSLTKMELIQKNVMEKTTGLEIIKRLIQYGFVEQFDDPDDKRSQRVTLTVAGREEIFRLLPTMEKVGDKVKGNLNDIETKELLFLLKKLDQFHFKEWEEKRDLF